MTDQSTSAGSLGRVTAVRELFGRLLVGRLSKAASGILLVFLLIAVFGPWFAPYDTAAMGPQTLSGPSASHLMGTDEFGRDVFSRFLQGTRVSVFVGLAATALAAVAGTLAGMLAGTLSGRVWDGLIMRAMDVVLAFPLLVLVPVVTGVVGERGLEVGPFRVTSVPLMTMAIALVFTPIFARVARSSVLAEMREEYITAVRSFGGRRRDVLFANLLPNIAAPLVVQAAFAFGGAVAVEAVVSFLGLGVQAPSASWGTLLSDGRQYITLGCWWLVGFPSVALALTVLSFNLLGDVLRDHLDPRARTSVVKNPIGRKARGAGAPRVTGRQGG